MAQGLQSAYAPYAIPSRWMVSILIAFVVLIGLVMHHMTLVVYERTAPTYLASQPDFKIEIIKDDQRRLTLGDVRSEAYAQTFQPLSTIHAEPAGCVWYRVTLPAYFPSRQAAIISTNPRILYEVVLYTPTASDGWKANRNGEAVIWKNRQIKSPDIAFELNLPPGSPRILYLRSTNPFSQLHPVDFLYWADENDYINSNNLNLFYTGAYFAVWLALLAYNGFLYAVLRQKEYLYFLSYSFCMGAFLAVATNFCNIFFPWPAWPLTGVLSFCLINFISISLLNFSRTFLGTLQHVPALDRVMRWIAYLLALQLLAVPLEFFPNAAQINFRIQVFLNLTGAVALLVAGFIFYFRKLGHASLYLFAFAPTASFLAWLLLHNIGLVPPPSSGIFTLFYASGAEFIILSIALAWRQQDKANDADILRTNFRRQLLLDVKTRTQELSDLTLRLEEANRDKDRVFSIIGHDLRGPAQSLRSITAMLGHSPDAFSPEELKELFTEIDRSSQAQLDLLENLLHWGQLQSGRLKPEFSTVGLKPACDAVIPLISPMARGKRITLVQNIPVHLAAWVDPRALQTVIRNLLNNALKFTPQGGTITLSAEEKENRVILHVSDTGIGIPADRIAQLSTQIVASTFGTDAEKGTGLGLVLCGDLIRANGGDMHFASTVGQGTTVTITLFGARTA